MKIYQNSNLNSPKNSCLLTLKIKSKRTSKNTTQNPCLLQLHSYSTLHICTFVCVCVHTLASYEFSDKELDSQGVSRVLAISRWLFVVASGAGCLLGICCSCCLFCHFPCWLLMCTLSQTDFCCLFVCFFFICVG